MSIQPIRQVVFDLHGVLIYQKAKKYQSTDAGQLIRFLRGEEIGVGFLTNSSSVNRQDMLDILTEIGIESTENEVFSSGLALAKYIRWKWAGSKALLVGKPGLKKTIEAECGGCVELVSDETADFVIGANTPTIDEKTLAIVRKLGQRNCPLLATSNEAKIPVQQGITAGPGRVVDRLEEAMGRKAQIVGKPNPFVLEAMYDGRFESYADFLIVGDSVLHDIKLGKAVGAQTVLIKSEATEPPPYPYQADYTINSLDQIKEICRRK